MARHGPGSPDPGTSVEADQAGRTGCDARPGQIGHSYPYDERDRPGGRGPRAGRRDRELRASYEDRDKVAEQLRVAAGDGRLTADELDQRLEAALTARTYGELAALTADLPGVARVEPDVPAVRPQRAVHASMSPAPA